MEQKKSLARKNGKYLPDNRKTSQKHGKSQKNIPLIIVLCLIGLLVAGIIGLLLFTMKDQKDFDRLSAMVRENAEKAATLPTAEPTVSDTRETQPHETTEPPATEPPMLAKYAPLYELNPDMYGWIRIDDTIIDYPVMYAPDEPEKYLHADFENQYSFSGVPFLDGSCTPESDNLIIYGHNMANGTMFRALTRYEEKSFWEQHPTICFDTLYEEQEYEVLAAFYDRVYYKSETVFKFYQFIDAENEADFEYAMQNYKEKALYDTGVTANYGDQLITLVTCAYHVENGRFVVVARRTSSES